ncbi:hypothetical protein NDN08_002039 [Rhodosorus marinus]|uniref:Uncharacterized protein n=1 Tax=Rhodosorus marinus TaxID=101924 RepID=A0AAV8UX05_9RHOD|nr:hypothetical protein NDN08_002039 [Rhodosorus marinus]
MEGSDSGGNRGKKSWLSQKAIYRLDRFLTVVLITVVAYKVGVYADYRLGKRRKRIAQELLEETKPKTSPSAFLEPEFDVDVDAADMPVSSQEGQEGQEGQLLGNNHHTAPAGKDNPGSLRLLDEGGRVKRRLAP